MTQQTTRSTPASVLPIIPVRFAPATGEDQPRELLALAALTVAVLALGALTLLGVARRVRTRVVG